MADSKSNLEGQKKILENPFVGSLMVPIAIVLVGAAIVFGVTKLLSTERDHKDIVRELESKTFGNRWVAAYELSKLISRSQIPKEDIPWLVDSLGKMLKESKEARARKFIVTALGAVKHPLVLPHLLSSLSDTDGEVQFQSIVALSHIPDPVGVDWSLIRSKLNSKDSGIVQVSIFTLATHRVEGAIEDIARFLSSDNSNLRYAAATALITFKDKRAVNNLKEILLLAPAKNTQKKGLSITQLSALKINVINALSKNKWSVLNSELELVAASEKDLKVVSMAKEALNILKK